MLCGMALVPDEETQRRIIGFQGKHMHTLNGPKLGTETNLPHVTVFQSRFNPKDLSRSDLVEILCATDMPEIPASKFTKVAYHPRHWVFAHIECPEWLTRLHEVALPRLDDKVLRKEINLSIDLRDHTVRQAAYYGRYGYRYSLEEYIPHVTLGCPLGWRWFRRGLRRTLTIRWAVPLFGFRVLLSTLQEKPGRSRKLSARYPYSNQLPPRVRQGEEGLSFCRTTLR